MPGWVGPGRGTLGPCLHFGGDPRCPLMTEHDQLLAMCQHLGAAPAQAEVMARQLAKRCDQLMADRGLSRVEAFSYLLRLVTQGRTGVPPEGFEGTQPPSPLPQAPVQGTETH